MARLKKGQSRAEMQKKLQITLNKIYTDACSGLSVKQLCDKYKMSNVYYALYPKSEHATEQCYRGSVYRHYLIVKIFKMRLDGMPREAIVKRVKEIDPSVSPQVIKCFVDVREPNLPKGMEHNKKELVEVAKITQKKCKKCGAVAHSGLCLQCYAMDLGVKLDENHVNTCDFELI
jgi:hypothetical protein